MSSIIVLRNIEKLYKIGKELIYALRDISLTVEKNEYVALMGPSGSGKSMLMNMLGCLYTPSNGEYILNIRCETELQYCRFSKLK